MFTINFVIAPDVLQTTGLTQGQLDNVTAGIQQAAALWSRYIDGNNAIIDIELDFVDLSGSALAEAGSSFFRRGNSSLTSEVITELNGQAGAFSSDGTFTIDLPSVLNDRFFFSDSLDFDANPGAPGQIDFLTLAAHELGHVLGFLGLSFEGFVENNQFIGANAVAANGGNPVPLADGVHTEGGDLLSPSISSNTREPLTEVLVAILQDLGVSLVEASNAADVLYGFQQNNDFLVGLGGEDQLFGFSGDDTIFGGDGNDTIFGGAGNDQINGGAGADILDGGEGTNDIVSYFDSDEAVNFNFGTQVAFGGDATGDTFANFESAVGSVFNDTLISDDTADTFFGGEGNDRIFGEGGDDRLLGQGGNDQINGGAGADTIDGGEGVDIVSFFSSDAAVNFNFETVTAFGGHADGDTLFNLESAVGSNFGDTLAGANATNDTFFGANGNDRIFGQGGNDRLFGQDGSDQINGGAGNDTIDGGAGIDRISYGDALFGFDTIQNFDADGNDFLDFRGSGLLESNLRFAETDGNVTARFVGNSGSNITFQDTTLAQLDTDDWLFG